MKRWFTTMAIVAALALPMNASAGGGSGFYDWALSFSDTVDEPTGPDPSGVTSIYLWFVAGCNTNGAEGPGVSAAEFKVNPSGASPWTILAFVTANGFLNAGSSTELLLAVGGCPAGPVVAGSFLVSASGAGGLWLGPTASGNAGTVNCDSNPSLYSWPEFNRFRGCQSVGSTFELQNHGAGCLGPVSVEDASWGSIKSLYR